MPTITLRPATVVDFDFAQRIYLAAGRIMTRGLFEWRQAEQEKRFAGQFKPEETRIIIADGAEIGWMQVRDEAASVFLAQLFLAEPHQGRGIGTRLLADLLDDARRRGKPVTLGVVKSNPAKRLYERLGFVVTREDGSKFYMRRDWSDD